MNAATLGAVAVIGGTLAATFALGPATTTTAGTSAAASLPATGAVTAPGSAAAVIRIRHGVKLEPPATPTEIYEQYVPPPPPRPVPTPAPAPVRAYVAPKPYTPPAGYVTIPVPIYRQAMTLDCETGALRMGLAYYGHYYSDSALFAYENPDLRAPVMGPNHTVLQWGDPYTNFVGNVWGSDTAPTGYGVYYPVIVSIARSHGLPNSYGGEGFSASTVYNALSARHPVEVWVETNWMRPWLGTWTAWDGRRIRYSLVEHAVILTGVSATQVRVNDPLHGTQYWISKSQFETVWRDFNDMAVIYQ
jgi:uncharacterized protein YvpB